ncbi:hypothetical protein M0R45_008646 [Rubus argutus]|uniref:Uncharacterized protein n=1 Tax=Rubus argutus TaxID=59490 RepID=A0AAW1Y1D7_RUBAR
MIDFKVLFAENALGLRFCYSLTWVCREIQVLCLQWDVESQELITKVMGDVSDHIGRPTDSVSLERNLIVWLFLQVIPFDNKGQLKEAFIIRLEELQVLDITFSLWLFKTYNCSSLPG